MIGLSSRMVRLISLCMSPKARANLTISGTALTVGGVSLVWKSMMGPYWVLAALIAWAGWSLAVVTIGVCFWSSGRPRRSANFVDATPVGKIYGPLH